MWTFNPTEALPSYPSPSQYPNANAKSKPKRPLSGYNLFYRYKRTMILEATAHLTPTSDTKAIIDGVLNALPGLENVNTRDHPLWTSYPPKVIDKLRASNIRASMKDNLYPNDNRRNRQHRKVHGIGFFEMNKTMRVMWGSIDGLGKEVFCELADVGRVYYRKSLAEWKLWVENGGGEQPRPAQLQLPPLVRGRDDENWVDQPAAKRLKTTHPNAYPAAAATTTISAAASAAAMASLAPVKIEATPNAAEKPQVASLSPLNIGTAENPQIVYVLVPAPGQAQAQAQAVATANIAYPIIPSFPSGHSIISETSAYRRSYSSDDSLEPLSTGTLNLATTADLASPNRPGYGRRVSDPVDLSRMNSLEPLSIGARNHATAADLAPPSRPGYGRRVSDPADLRRMNSLEPLSIRTLNHATTTDLTPPTRPGHGRRVSDPADLRRMNSLEPLSIGTLNHATTTDLASPPKRGRSVSNPNDLNPMNGNSNCNRTVVCTPAPDVMGRNGSGAANDPAVVFTPGNSRPVSDNNTPAGLMMNNTTTMNNKATEESTNEFQHQFQQLFAEDAAINQNSIGLANPSSMNSVGQNSNQNYSIMVPPSPPFQPVPPQQHIASQNNDRDGVAMLMSTGVLRRYHGESGHPKTVNPGFSWPSNNIDVARDGTDNIDSSCNNSVVDLTDFDGIVGNGLNIDASGTVFENHQGSVVSENTEEASPQDYMELIGQLDEAIDQHDDDHHSFSAENNSEDWFDHRHRFIVGLDQATEVDRYHHTATIEKMNNNKKYDNLSFVFGKPVHAVPMNSANSAVPMPTAFELNDNRARMA